MSTLLWTGLAGALAFTVFFTYAACYVAGDADERAGLK